MTVGVFKLCFISLAVFGLIGLNKCSEVNTRCACSDKKNSCKCSGLQYIPVLPNTTRTLILDSNNFPHLRRETFQNVSTIRLKILILKHNSIERIDCDVFSDLKFLERLNINHEESIHINDLKISFKSLNFWTINNLHLGNNKLNSLPPDMFNLLYRAINLTSIFLRNNELQKLDSSLFIPLTGLRTVSSDSNYIAYVNTKYFSTIENLYLSNNKLFNVPNFCNNITGKTTAPNLKELSLSYNAIRYLNIDSFKCLNVLQKLILDGNHMIYLENNIFAQLHSLSELSIGYIENLRIIKDHAFNISSLQTLKFYRNYFRFDRSTHYRYNKVFHFLPDLRVLDLGKNFLTNQIINLKMLGNLQNLRKLHLDTTYINTIPIGLLQKMPKLEELYLSGNNLRQLDTAIFENMASLKTLKIAGNQLHTINATSFPPGFLEGLDVLDMANNPFWCTCDQMWFINFLRTTNITKKLTSWPEFYKCDYPENLRFMNLSKYNPNDGECRPFKIISIVITIVSSTAMFVFFGVIILLQCQVNIRNVLYFVRVCRRIKQGYIKLDSSGDFEFDAFVIYCDADSQWVHGVLLKKLESAGLKICVHHRDFDVGEPVINNIEKYMNKSWKVIVIMSNNFAKSEWCQWELDLVQERRRQKGKEAIVLIMYLHIDYRHMTSSLRTLLHTTPHLTYKEGFGEQLFWKTVIRDINKQLNFPPVALT